MAEREEPNLDLVRETMREHDENAEQRRDREPDDAAREPDEDEQDSEDEG
jgi:hypothetical protein